MALNKKNNVTSKRMKEEEEEKNERNKGARKHEVKSSDMNNNQKTNEDTQSFTRFSFLQFLYFFLGKRNFIFIFAQFLLPAFL